MTVTLPGVNLLVAGLLLLTFTAAGLLAGRVLAPRNVYLVGGAFVVAAGLLFVPVRCATGDMATPFSSGLVEKPTGCETLPGVGLPELGMFSGDTVGYGLLIASLGLAFAAALLVLPRPAAD